MKENNLELDLLMMSFSLDEVNITLGKLLDLFMSLNDKFSWEAILFDFSSFRKFWNEIVPLDANLNACGKISNLKDNDVSLQNSWVPKLQDLRCFSISCQIKKRILPTMHFVILDREGSSYRTI